MIMVSTLAYVFASAAAEAKSDQSPALATCDQRNGPEIPFSKARYADPEAAIFGNQYWIYPILFREIQPAGVLRRLFFDRFGSLDQAQPNSGYETASPGRNRACGPTAVAERNGKYYFFFGANTTFMMRKRRLAAIRCRRGRSTRWAPS